MKTVNVSQHPWRYVTALALALCSCDKEPSVLVHLSGWPDGAEYLRVTPYLDGEVRDVVRVEKQSPGFVVSIPEGRAGQLRLDVAGVDIDQCDMAHGEVQEYLGPGLRFTKEESLRDEMKRLAPHRAW